MQKTIIILGTLDTKSEEILFARDCIRKNGHRPIVIDLSVGNKPNATGDITSSDVACAAGANIDTIWGNPDRPSINKIITEGAIQIVRSLYEEGQLSGILGIGGTGGTLIETDIMKCLPFGIPKFMVSSNAAAKGFASRYFGTKDITMMNTVVDIAGLNDIIKTLIAQAVAAICAMSKIDIFWAKKQKNHSPTVKTIALCELMLSADSVRRIKNFLETLGYQVIVFMATGVGDAAMEEMIGDGMFDAVLDLSPGGILDGLVGGTRKACPQRLESAGRIGLPQIIVPGGLDFITPPRSRYKAEYDARKSFRPDKLRLQIRSSCAELELAAEVIAGKLNRSRGPVKFFIPLKGWSRIDGPGRPLDDPVAIRTFTKALKEHCEPKIQIIECDQWIEDPEFQQTIVNALRIMLLEH